MELKAKLNRPYTEKEKIDFIAENNHKNGFEIRETIEGIEAWGYTEEEKAEERKEEFLKQFFKIDGYGYFRKQPKGYGSAVESLNTAFNIVTVAGSLPANTLTFYTKPDFTNAEQCTEDWLVAHQFKNETMTPTEFGAFYAKFIEAWNKQEHL